MSKKTTEHFCINCSCEYMVTRDENIFEEEPTFCPFCSHVNEEDLYQDDFQDYVS